MKVALRFALMIALSQTVSAKWVDLEFAPFKPMKFDSFSIVNFSCSAVKAENSLSLVGDSEKGIELTSSGRVYELEITQSSSQSQDERSNYSFGASSEEMSLSLNMKKKGDEARGVAKITYLESSKRQKVLLNCKIEEK